MPTSGSLMAISKRGEARKWLEAHADWHKDECLIFPFPRSSSGYGLIGVEGRRIGAHRVMCELAHGPAPTPKYDARHLCGKGQEGCVNPLHLAWGTRSQNVVDAIEHGTFPRGERCWNAILNEEQARAIFLETRPQSIVAKEYGVKREVVNCIWRRHSWAWATSDLTAPERPNANCRLTDEDIRAIRNDRRSGNEIADEYGIKRRTVYAIRGRRRRGSVEDHHAN